MTEAQPAPRKSWLRRIIVLVLAVVLAAYAGACLGIVRQSKTYEARPADAIVVFGAAEYSGRPSPVLRARLDHAFNLYELNFAKTIIVTGGHGGEQSYSEGGVGAGYLLRRGIPEHSLIAETQADNTAESAERVGAIMRTNNMHSAIAVSDAFHMFRIKKMLEAQGVTVYGAPRPGSVAHTRGGRMWTVMREALSYLVWKVTGK